MTQDEETKEFSTALLVTAPRCTSVTSDGANMVEPSSCVHVCIDKQQESSFGATDAQELQERPTSKSLLDYDYDISHGYKYEYDDVAEDDEEDSSLLGQSDQSAKPIDLHKVFITKSDERFPYMYLLGKTFHPLYESQLRKEFEASLYWFTYRWDFPEIKPYNITSDAGWGCMLRSAQMLLAHTLRVHFKSRTWKPPTSIAKCRDDPFIIRLLTWFADFPSRNESIYSLHNMVAAGFAKYETLPGEWYGPGTACYVLRDLVSLHEQSQPSMFRVHIAAEGTVYRHTVRSLMTKDSKRRAEERKKENESSNQSTPLHPLDPSIPPPSLDEDDNLDWDTALLLLIPLRLGLDKFNEDYREVLARSFWLPQSVGVLGGRPRGARWFFGAYADGTKVLGLDPHTVQSAPQRKILHASAGNHSKESNVVVDLSDEYMQSVHSTYPEVYPISRMDPSIALGFYCRDKKDFADLESSLNKLKVNSSSPDLFTFAEHAPDYSLSSAVSKMVMGDMEDDMPGDNAADSDDDEYVLL
jgi:cysteine protease ATG4